MVVLITRIFCHFYKMTKTKIDRSVQG